MTFLVEDAPNGNAETTLLMDPMRGPPTMRRHLRPVLAAFLLLGVAPVARADPICYSLTLPPTVQTTGPCGDGWDELVLKVGPDGLAFGVGLSMSSCERRAYASTPAGDQAVDTCALPWVGDHVTLHDLLP